MPEAPQRCWTIAWKWVLELHLQEQALGKLDDVSSSSALEPVFEEPGPFTFEQSEQLLGPNNGELGHFGYARLD
jgi:hypothetical protein